LGQFSNGFKKKVELPRAEGGINPWKSIGSRFKVEDPRFGKPNARSQMSEGRRK
jgi:hypothetical protein